MIGQSSTTTYRVTRGEHVLDEDQNAGSLRDRAQLLKRNTPSAPLRIVEVVETRRVLEVI